MHNFEVRFAIVLNSEVNFKKEQTPIGCLFFFQRAEIFSPLCFPVLYAMGVVPTYFLKILIK